MVGCEAQEPLALLQVLACLDGDGAVDATLIEQRAEVVGEEVALQGVEAAFGDPTVPRLVVGPEVLMGVDGHGEST